MNKRVFFQHYNYYFELIKAFKVPHSQSSYGLQGTLKTIKEQSNKYKDINMFTPKDNRYPLSIPTPKNGARPPRFNSGRATRSQQQNQKKRRQDKFTGLEDALGDYTYTLVNLQADNFTTTTNSISQYVDKT